MKKFLTIALAITMIAGFLLTGCEKKDDAATDKPAEEKTEDVKADADAKEEDADVEEEDADVEDAEDEDDDAGFDEWPVGDPVKLGEMNFAPVYFQPVDMEPAGNSLKKEDADCHLEADITALGNSTLGYGKGDTIPYLKVKAYITKEGSEDTDEIAFMPMNAADGFHYGANVKFKEGLGKYNIKFEVAAPGNDYLLHVDEETGVEGKFWTEPLVQEYEFEWAGAQW